MKNNFLKKTLRLSMVALLGLMTIVSSCKKDDPKPIEIPVEDGIYVKGAGTALTDFDTKGLMKVTRNEVGQAERAGLVELYVAVKAGTDGFNIIIVTGGKPKVYGPGDDFALVAEEDKISDEPREWLSRGSLKETATPFTVPEDGLYHVVYDQTLNVVAVARAKWGLIGGATQNGWGGSTPLTESAFNLNTMTFQGTEIILTLGDYKFRYSSGWKIVLDGELVRVNTNFGGAVNALVPGGDNIANTVNGYYTITVTWNLDNGITATVVKTGDYVPPAYPEAMYIVGAATAYGWDTPGTVDNAIMHKCAGGSPTEGLFWKICHLTADQGFKLAAANWGEPNLGFAQVDEFDTEGVTVTDVDGNMKIAESGMYMVVLDLRNATKKVSIKPAAVYGIGDAFGGWDAGVAGNLFTVDNVNKLIVSPALAANGNIRMYASHAWIPDWWNAEFNVYEGVIEYRNDGNDQAAVPGTAGQVVTLSFDDNTGSIATPPGKK